MRRSTIVFLIAVFLLLSGCSKQFNSPETMTVKRAENNSDKKSTMSSKPNESRKSIKIGFKFKHYLMTTDYAGEIPRTDISLIISSDKTTEYKLGPYDGTAEEFPKANYKSSQIPKDALFACSSWWAGAGDDIYVIKKNETKLAVMRRPKGEPNGPNDTIYIPIFKEIKQFEIPETDRIEVSPIIKIKENN